MNLVPAGTGGAVMSVAAVTFLVLLAVFIAVMTCIACRYHAHKPGLRGPSPQPRRPGRSPRQPPLTRNKGAL